jgi:hypothetical protein
LPTIECIYGEPDIPNYYQLHQKYQVRNRSIKSLLKLNQSTNQSTGKISLGHEFHYPLASRLVSNSPRPTRHHFQQSLQNPKLFLFIFLRFSSFSFVSFVFFLIQEFPRNVALILKTDLKANMLTCLVLFDPSRVNTSQVVRVDGPIQLGSDYRVVTVPALDISQILKEKFKVC